MRVRIKATPQQSDIDGVRLDDLTPGTVRTVSASVGAWLIAEGYADTEMRRNPPDEKRDAKTPLAPDRRDLGRRDRDRRNPPR